MDRFSDEVEWLWIALFWERERIVSGEAALFLKIDDDELRLYIIYNIISDDLWVFR